LGHVTRKIVSEMTYNVLSGTLNSTILYYTYTIQIVFHSNYGCILLSS